jgi:hypothetical protein
LALLRSALDFTTQERRKNRTGYFFFFYFFFFIFFLLSFFLFFFSPMGFLADFRAQKRNCTSNGMQGSENYSQGDFLEA